MIDVAPLRSDLRKLAWFRYVMLPVFGVNVFWAVYYVVTPTEVPVLQYAAVFFNIVGSVYAWDSLLRNVKFAGRIEVLIEQIERANKFYLDNRHEKT